MYLFFSASTFRSSHYFALLMRRRSSSLGSILRPIPSPIGISVFNAYHVYLVCCAGVRNIFKFIVSLGAIILRVGATSGLRVFGRRQPEHGHCNYRGVLRIWLVFISRSHSVRSPSSEFSPSACCVLSRHGSSSRTQTRAHTHPVPRVVFILFDTLAK